VAGIIFVPAEKAQDVRWAEVWEEVDWNGHKQDLSRQDIEALQ
jgi:hypothetical protein